MADRFPFVQLDFLRLLGPADGRYRVPPTEEGQVDRVIAIDTLRAGAAELGGVEELRFWLFDDATYAAYEKALAAV